MKKSIFLLLSLFLLVSGLWMPEATSNAASSYTNAYEFYISTGENSDKHTGTKNYTFYWGTCYKLSRSSSSNSLRYLGIGFDVTIHDDNGTEITYTLPDTNTDIWELVDEREVDGYQYGLYAISTENLRKMVTLADSTKAKTILSAPKMHIRMDAIFTTRRSGEIHGSISVDANGKCTDYGKVYHLKEEADLATMRSIFGASGHTFNDSIDIRENFSNYYLQLRYNVQGTAAAISGSSSSAVINKSGYSVVDNLLYKNGSTYVEKYYGFEHQAKLQTQKTLL